MILPIDRCLCLCDAPRWHRTTDSGGFLATAFSCFITECEILGGSIKRGESTWALLKFTDVKLISKYAEKVNWSQTYKIPDLRRWWEHRTKDWLRCTACVLPADHSTARKLVSWLWCYHNKDLYGALYTWISVAMLSRTEIYALAQWQYYEKFEETQKWIKWYC